jgi:predicted nuclease of predicted toxin-antitoxin system
VKLLFDHHLSPTLVARLGELFPESNHVWHLGLHDVTDETVWLFAREHGFMVVSKDADFSEISMALGYPPKLIWLRIKNWPTNDIEHLIRTNYSRIAELHNAADRGILVLFKKSAH